LSSDEYAAELARFNAPRPEEESDTETNVQAPLSTTEESTSQKPTPTGSDHA
jgi:hypothetical protein